MAPAPITPIRGLFQDMQPPFYLRQGRKQIVDMAAEFFLE